MECKSTKISPRLTVTGPDLDGEYEIAIDAGEFTFITRAQADVLIAALAPSDSDSEDK